LGKKYDGKIWDIEEIQTSELPEDLLINILGNREKRILFIEGENGSSDYKLLSKCYTDYLVIPVGSNSNIKQRVKNFNNTQQLFSNYEIFGIIDRDYKKKQI
jgi:hypothetical protein